MAKNQRVPLMALVYSAITLAAATIVPGTPALSADRSHPDKTAISQPVIPEGCPIPDGFGVNIHFTDPRPGEMKMLSEGGFKWVRMDFGWAATERTKGVYDFSSYDHLIAALKPYGIRPIFILDYSNDLYDRGLSPYTEEGRQAFAKWAAAAVTHFKGLPCLWEMYNEPNIVFWRPTPRVQDYVALALAVGKAIQQADPSAVFVGPALSTFDFPFIEACFKAGCLNYWQAVSVHPYRGSNPETADRDYQKLRLLIRQYEPHTRAVKGQLMGPDGRRVIPILSGEWGYSTAWNGMTEDLQAQFLVRQWLNNISNDIPLSIWYDWHDDGTNPKDPEHNFGTVRYPYTGTADPVYQPKPAYTAARTLTTLLNGFVYNKRLWISSPADYVLLFSRGSQDALVVWTTGSQHSIVVPSSPGVFQQIDLMGSPLPDLTAHTGGIKVDVSRSPKYLFPKDPNAFLQIAAGWSRTPLEVVARAPGHAGVATFLKNPLSTPIEIRFRGLEDRLDPGRTLKLAQQWALDMTAGPVRHIISLEIPGMGTLSQKVDLVASNPLIVTMAPADERHIQVRIVSPSGQPFKGSVDVTGLQAPSQEVVLSAHDPAKSVLFDLGAVNPTDNTLGVQIKSHESVCLTVPPIRRVQVDDLGRYTAATLNEAYRVEAGGDPKVACVSTLRAYNPGTAQSQTPPAPPIPGMSYFEISYHFSPGWKYLELVPLTPSLKTIGGMPDAMGLWVYSSSEGSWLRIRFSDELDQVFQPTGVEIDWKGWRWVQIPLDHPEGFWGGPGDGVIHYPIQFQDLLLLDNTGEEDSAGKIYVSRPTLIYQTRGLTSDRQ